MEVKAGYQQTEVGVIPKDWITRTLESAVGSGGLVRGPFGGALKKDIFVDRGYKVYEQRKKECHLRIGGTGRLLH